MTFPFSLNPRPLPDKLTFFRVLKDERFNLPLQSLNAPSTRALELRLRYLITQAPYRIGHMKQHPVDKPIHTRGWFTVHGQILQLSDQAPPLFCRFAPKLNHDPNSDFPDQIIDAGAEDALHTGTFASPFPSNIF